MGIRSLTNFIELRKIGYGMQRAETFPQWNELAQRHDFLSGADQWKLKEDTDLYDARQIRKRYKVLQNSLESRDKEETLFALNEGIHGNMGGMGKSALYRQSKRGTKKLVDDYVGLVVRALRQVGDAPESEIPHDEKLDFFRRASHCYGRSALSLSGGSGYIYFHHGVIDALLENDLLPNVLSGASSGSWIAAQVGVHTDDELRHYFKQKRYNFISDANVGLMFDLLRGKGRADIENERDDVIDDFVGNITFQEAFEHTGRYINIPIAPVERHQTSRLMNAITSPNVTIRSAVKASSTIPGMLEPAELEAKDSRGRLKPYLRSRRWVDGSFAQELPSKRLARLFGVNHYIVSMANPLALPFLKDDVKTSDGNFRQSLRTISRAVVREALKSSRSAISPVKLGAFDSLLGTLYKLIDQDYLGDINLILSQSDMRGRYAWFDYRDDGEIQALITAGHKAVWPKLDQIRNSVQISHVIDEILERLEAEAVSTPHARHKLHMTI